MEVKDAHSDDEVFELFEMAPVDFIESSDEEEKEIFQDLRSKESDPALARMLACKNSPLMVVLEALKVDATFLLTILQAEGLGTVEALRDCEDLPGTLETFAMSGRDISALCAAVQRQAVLVPATTFSSPVPEQPGDTSDQVSFSPSWLYLQNSGQV